MASERFIAVSTTLAMWYTNVTESTEWTAHLESIAQEMETGQNLNLDAQLPARTQERPKMADEVQVTSDITEPFDSIATRISGWSAQVK